MQEVWLSAPGYEGIYSASNLGRIRSERLGATLNQTIDKRGYPMVSLSVGGIKEHTKVHRTVLATFCGAGLSGIK